MRLVFCIVCAALWGGVAYAVVGPASVADDSSALGSAADLEPTDSWFIQAIKVTEDNDTNDLQVNSITIKNNAATPLADASDIDKIEIYQLSSIAGASPTQAECAAGTLRGSTTDIASFNSSGGVAIALSGAVVAPNDTEWFCVKVTTKSGLVPGRKILSRFLSAAGIDPATVGGTWSGGSSGDAPNTFVTKASGLASSSADVTPSGHALQANQLETVQELNLQDATDANPMTVGLTSLLITNLGTAQAGSDINRIEVYNCGTDNACGTGDDALVGLLDPVSSWPVTVPLAGAAIADDGSRKFALRVRIAPSATATRTIRLSTTVNVLENGFTSSTAPLNVPTDKESVINTAGFETFQILSGFTPPATITPGESGVVVLKVQAKDGTTSGDANSQSLTITSITINNLGTATLFGDITNIRIKCSGGGDCDGSTFHVNQSYSASAAFPQTFSGLDIDIPDDANATFEVQVTLQTTTSTPGDTVQLALSLAGTEGALGSFSQGPVNHAQLTTIASGVGCETLSDSNTGPATITSGTADTTVQTVMCTDSDGNSNSITVNSIAINQLGDAGGGTDITKITVDGPGSACDGTKALTASDAFPVTITFSGCSIPDNTSGAFAIKIDVSSTLGKTVQTSGILTVTEAGQTVTHTAVPDGTPSTIVGGADRGCEAVSDLAVDAGDLSPGASAVVQRLFCQDSDGAADTHPVQITQVNVRNLGTATASEITKIEIVRTDTNTVLGSTTNTSGLTTTGVNIPVGVTVPDDGLLELGVKISVSAASPAGRTLRLRTTLRHFEGGAGPFTKSADDALPERIVSGSVPDTTPPTVQLLSPTQGQSLSAGSEVTIEWTCTDPEPSAGFGPTAVKLLYSLDGGETHEIAGGTPNDGTFTWRVPNSTSGAVGVRIVCTDLAGNSAHDETEVTIVPVGPSLAATLEASLGACTEGYPIIYTVKITNLSSGGAQPDNPTHELEIPLPSGVTYREGTATVGQVSFQGGHIVWDGTLAPNSQTVITVRLSSSLPTGSSIALGGRAFFDHDLNGVNESSIQLAERPLTVIRLGDINGDRAVNAIDARLALMHAHGTLSLTEVSMRAADVDCDSSVTEADATSVARRALEMPTQSGNPAFALVMVIGFGACLLMRRRSALLVVLLGGGLGMLTACVDTSLPAPPSGPAMFVESLLVPRGSAAAFVAVKAQQITVGRGVASVQGELGYDPKVVQVKGLTGRNGFRVLAWEVDPKAGRVRFIAVRPTPEGITDGELVQLSVAPVGPSNSKTALTWSKSLVGTAEHGLAQVTAYDGQIRVR